MAGKREFVQKGEPGAGREERGAGGVMEREEEPDGARRRAVASSSRVPERRGTFDLRRILRILPTVALVLAAAPVRCQVWAVGNYFWQDSGATASDFLGSAVAVGDFDGDGRRDDFAWGEPGGDDSGLVAAGIVWVGLGDGSRHVPALVELADEQAGAYFGQALAVGDFDGDGADDIAVGAPYEDVTYGGQSRHDAGAVQIFHVVGASVLPEQVLSQADVPSLSVPEADDHFGWALAAGNFNGDSYDDLAVGVPDEGVAGAEDGGIVEVFYGGSTGLRLDNADAFYFSPPAAGDRYGFSLASGDFDDDGNDDLAVGIPLRTVSGSAQDGEVMVYDGSGTGLVHSPAHLMWEALFGPPSEAGEQFGFALAAGRLNETVLSCFSSCYDDLVIGAPFRTVDGQAQAGEVLVAYGSPAGPLTANGAVLTQADAGATPGANDLFGDSLAVGDLDRPDNFLYDIEDLAVGAPGESYGGIASAGEVEIFFGAFTGLGAGGATQRIGPSQALQVAPPLDYDFLGLGLAIGDLDGDGWGDLIAGVPGRDDGAIPDVGGVEVLYGALFADGFGAGDTNAWQVVNP